MATKRTRTGTMRKSHYSDTYTIDRENYNTVREELMIKFLDEFFWKCFFMLRTNRIQGVYLEFGSGSNVRSFRLAYKYKTLEYSSPRLFSFDSFEGLPEPEGIDKHPQWRKGAMAVSLERFHNIMRNQGASIEEYATVPGFYDTTLKNFSPLDYGINDAAMIFVDCDLYASTTYVLDFVKDILIDGSILAFDDWYCFNGDPNKGEQKAFWEFCAKNPDISFSEYLNFGWHGKSFIVHHSHHSDQSFHQEKHRPTTRNSLMSRIIHKITGIGNKH